MRRSLYGRACCCIGIVLGSAATSLALISTAGASGAAVPSATDASPQNQAPPPLTREAPLQETVPTLQLPDGREVIPGHVLVGLQQSPAAAIGTAVRQRIAARLGGVAPAVLQTLGSGVEVDSVPTDRPLDDVLREYRADPGVAFAEPDVLRPMQSVTNDPLAAYQWNLAPIRATSGWSAGHGQASVRVAMVDSGIFDDGSHYLAPDGKPGHPDLRGKVDLRHDFTTTDPTLQDPDDWVGHGTHTAGIAAATANNGLGVAGVGYDTHLLNAKACTASSYCADSWVIAAINWSVQNGTKVISLTGAAPSSCPASIQSAIDNAWNNNVVVVAPAGNSGNSQPAAPGDCNHVVSVASTNADDTRSSFSEYGSWITVAAPGGQDAAGDLILSTGYTGLYEYREGTSMATPVVSGLAALIWASPYGTSAQAVVQRITSTADRIPGTGTQWQAGRVNVAAALGATPLLVPAATPITTQVPIPPGWGRPPGLQWNTRAPMTTPRNRVGAAALGSRIYVVGGANSSWQAVNTVEAYDSVANTWQSLPSLPSPNAAPGVAAANGRVYVAGGTPDGINAFNSMLAFDPSSNTWTSLAPMPTGRWGLVLQTGPDGKLYAIGGKNASAASLPTVEAYDPVANTWSARAAMPTPRLFPAATLGPTNGRIYVAGGVDPSNRPLAAYEVYDPASNSWVTRPPLPTPRASLGLAAVPDGHIFAAGGDGPGTLDSVDEYTPNSTSWSPAAAMPRARGGGFGLVTAPNGVVYAVGGWTNGSLVAPIDAATFIAPKS